MILSSLRFAQPARFNEVNSVFPLKSNDVIFSLPLKSSVVILLSVRSKSSSSTPSASFKLVRFSAPVNDSDSSFGFLLRSSSDTCVSFRNTSVSSGLFVRFKLVTAVYGAKRFDSAAQPSTFNAVRLLQLVTSISEIFANSLPLKSKFVTAEPFNHRDASDEHPATSKSVSLEQCAASR